MRIKFKVVISVSRVGCAEKWFWGLHRRSKTHIVPEGEITCAESCSATHKKISMRQVSGRSV